MLRVPPSLALLALLSTATPCLAQQVESLTEDANREGLLVLDRAAGELGAEEPPGALPAPIVVWLSGETFQRFQSRSPEPPFRVLPSEEQVVVEPGRDRIGFEFRALWPDFVRHLSQHAGPDGGVVRDFNQGTVRWDDQLTPERLSALRRRLPSLVVSDALERATTVRLLGRGAVDGRPVDAVSYLERGDQLVTLYLERNSGRPVASEILVNDVRHGKVAQRTRYEDWDTRAGYAYASTVTTSVGGTTVETLRVDSMSLEPTRIAAAMARRSWFATRSSGRASCCTLDDEDCERVYMIPAYAKGTVDTLTHSQENELRKLRKQLIAEDC